MISLFNSNIRSSIKNSEKVYILYFVQGFFFVLVWCFILVANLGQYKGLSSTFIVQVSKGGGISIGKSIVEDALSIPSNFAIGPIKACVGDSCFFLSNPTSGGKFGQVLGLLHKVLMAPVALAFTVLGICTFLVIFNFCMFASALKGGSGHRDSWAALYKNTPVIGSMAAYLTQPRRMTLTLVAISLGFLAIFFITQIAILKAVQAAAGMDSRFSTKAGSSIWYTLVCIVFLTAIYLFNIYTEERAQPSEGSKHSDDVESFQMHQPSPIGQRTPPFDQYRI